MKIKKFIRKIKNAIHLMRSGYIANRCYFKRFKKYSFHGTKCTDEKQYEAVITRWYHTIEKGLAYVDYRAGFGKKNIQLLLTSMENYIADGYDKSAFFFQTALSTLSVYIEKNKQYDVEDKELKQRVNRLGDSANTCGGGTAFYSVEFG